MLSTIPCSGFLYLQFLARCHPYILFHFSCFLHLYVQGGQQGGGAASGSASGGGAAAGGGGGGGGGGKKKLYSSYDFTSFCNNFVGIPGLGGMSIGNMLNNPAFMNMV